jgi:hypothetical protein
MIIIKISGGLGNQLFQYSFGRYLSAKLNVKLKFDIQTNYRYNGFTQRSFGLSSFSFTIDKASVLEINNFKYFINNEFLARIERKLVQKVPSVNRKYIVQCSNDYQKNIKRIRDNCYYDGYWQSEQYFKPIESTLRNEYNLKLTLNNRNLALLDEINSSESISIHIRRCDYITNKANRKLFEICPFEYYLTAINFFTTRFKHAMFYIFSDDIYWTKSNFIGKQFRFIDNNSEYPEIDMYLMSKCRHNIIANSSFSWWGAWLNSNPDKIVIAPENWFKSQFNESIKDLIPPDWILH